jgi:alkylated DNA repair protein alkB homolog 1
MGCDALFLIGLDGCEEALVVRVRSGDVVVMGGESRWAWHSVPKVLAGTCPEGVENWPEETRKGWMKGKRVNLNVRQMWD